MKNILTALPTILVENGAFSHKIDYVAIFFAIINLEGHINCSNGSRVTGILLNG